MKQTAKHTKRMLALLLALIILCSFFSVLPLCRYPGHRCDETHCVLCMAVRAAEALLRQMHMLLCLATVRFAFCLLPVLLPLLLRRAARAPTTPVTLKTEILN